MHSFHIEWRKSSFSQNENCVEVADLPGATAVRDTQHRDLMLLFPSAEWVAFVKAAKRDLL
ncbi:hypothetical protein JCM3263A_14990 [Thermobifida fusca]|jgi:hypothetical protein|uniref:DUF397 domain-containing protein n=2 Tax=Thermobifida fusca TaxID=2021 RepID=A0A9P2WRY3_THEFU|nr:MULTISPECIES: DUF397 domain-containing protein [Thermobifida]AAZ54253.1 hypothetical protein Tfu_0215 [Thermobifida fusca YX]EOR72675.1 hypothetical protein TM51_01408 [Thermobifida fusca TM51]MBO2529878.1 DUF397 domain-containing protein [Thermobifida sp.]MDD6791887.1 DUF397 domain-containing protein [Thermobifida fusca]PPS94012.1 hypothetical protein BH05_06495 [Thermobifida fusca]